MLVLDGNFSELPNFECLLELSKDSMIEERTRIGKDRGSKFQKDKRYQSPVDQLSSSILLTFHE